ncbi:MAG: rhomboid family intramembrane serine protease [Candidatus Pacearchaeota archaeon]
MNKKRISITLILVLTNFLLFLVSMILLYINKSFADYLALKPANILQGKYLWTIILSMFIHAGFFHLFANMVSLIFLGSFLERIIGKKRFVFIYFISGIFASIAFILFSLLIKSEFNVYAVGASGAIFGIAAVIMILTPKLRVFIFPIPIAMPIYIAILIALFGLWAISLAAGLPIGNTAHLGGFIAGLVYGLFLRLKYKRKVMLINKYLGIR